MNWKSAVAVLILVLVGCCARVGAGDFSSPPHASARSQHALANAAYRLVVACETGGSHGRERVIVTLDDQQTGLRLAHGPYLYRAERREGQKTAAYCGLRSVCIEVVGDSATGGPRRLTILGKLAGLDVEHSFDLPADRPIMEERLVVHNHSRAGIRLSDLETGFARRVADKSGKVLPELAGDRFVAVPFRSKPDDLKPHYNDFSTAELIGTPGYEMHVDFDQHYRRIPASHRQSEGWAWTHGAHTLGIFKFDQENMQWSILATEKQPGGTVLHFGGTRMIDGEPSDLGRLRPGQTLRLGVTRYQTVAGGYDQAMYAFRALLDENGCRFPKGFNPPVHWEQLYDMEGAWNDRLHKYTKAILEKEAKKGVAYSCEALYLDPGWDTGFATFLWGDQWLGPRKAFVDEMQSKYGLKVSLHTPLASWMSIGWPMGPDLAPATYPPEAHRKAAKISDPRVVKAPATDHGRRNLALLPEAKASASSLYADGGLPIHQIAHLNDGWGGNRASWIAKTLPAWAEIDLGRSYTIAQVRLSNDATRQYSDRKPVDYRILVATKYDPDSRVATWSPVAEVSGEPLLGARDFSFAPCQARWVRVQILKSEGKEPRLDEIQIYEAQPLAANDIPAWESHARRSPDAAAIGAGASTICLGSQAYLDEAARRLLANCADGVTFLMYDGNWYQGGCDDATHGHPVPFTKEDHMRANVALAQRIHAKYPQVLIEMHDMLMGGANPRNTPVYYKYGLTGSYDDNWGFELMWDPMTDITSGRARSLYYYNLGCNVPIYLHIDLRKDRPGLPVLWWYASTCRHLGIGGTHKDPAVVAAQKAAMRKYHALERFFKRGDFYGANEQVHLHALTEENAFVANLFNLSDQKRVISGSIALARMGLRGTRLAAGPDDGSTPQSRTGQPNIGLLENGVWTIRREMAPWSADVISVQVTP